MFKLARPILTRSANFIDLIMFPICLSHLLSLLFTNVPLLDYKFYINPPSSKPFHKFVEMTSRLDRFRRTVILPPTPAQKMIKWIKKKTHFCQHRRMPYLRTHIGILFSKHKKKNMYKEVYYTSTVLIISQLWQVRHLKRTISVIIWKPYELLNSEKEVQIIWKGPTCKSCQLGPLKNDNRRTLYIDGFQTDLN